MQQRPTIVRVKRKRSAEAPEDLGEQFPPAPRLHVRILLALQTPQRSG